MRKVAFAVGFAAFFSHPARVALTIVTLALSFATVFSAGNLSSGEREDPLRAPPACVSHIDGA
jgi:hypothetical protein